MDWRIITKTNTAHPNFKQSPVEDQLCVWVQMPSQMTTMLRIHKTRGLTKNDLFKWVWPVVRKSFFKINKLISNIFRSSEKKLLGLRHRSTIGRWNSNLLRRSFLKSEIKTAGCLPPKSILYKWPWQKVEQNRTPDQTTKNYCSVRLFYATEFKVSFLVYCFPKFNGYLRRQNLWHFKLVRLRPKPTTDRNSRRKAHAFTTVAQKRSTSSCFFDHCCAHRSQTSVKQESRAFPYQSIAVSNESLTHPLIRIKPHNSSGSAPPFLEV